MNMDDDYLNPLPGKTYISPSLQAFGDKNRQVRIASKVFPSEDGYEYVKERDEIVLRKKPDAATNITAKVIIGASREIELDLARGADDDLAGDVEEDRGERGDQQQAQAVVDDFGVSDEIGRAHV